MAPVFPLVLLPASPRRRIPPSRLLTHIALDELHEGIDDSGIHYLARRVKGLGLTDPRQSWATILYNVSTALLRRGAAIEIPSSGIDPPSATWSHPYVPYCIETPIQPPRLSYGNLLRGSPKMSDVARHDMYPPPPPRLRPANWSPCSVPQQNTFQFPRIRLN
jgi:hypothetical protein